MLEKAGLQTRSRQPRVPGRRLRLHHLQRHVRALARADRGGHRAAETGGHGRALRQPQFRGPHPSQRARGLSGLAGARRRLCAGRCHDDRPHASAAWPRRRGRAGVPAGTSGHRARRSAARCRPHPIPHMFRDKYADVFDGDATWNGLARGAAARFAWDSALHLSAPPTLFRRARPQPRSARFHRGDASARHPRRQITTDHISPSGAISLRTPGADFLIGNGVKPAEFNSYGTRRGNYEVFMRAVSPTSGSATAWCRASTAA